MKVIFLDFDGVLNNPGCYAIASGSHTPADPRSVEALNHITNETGAFIVVSSTWRFGRRVVDLREILRGWGVAGTVVDSTPQLIKRADGIFVQGARHEEIQRWITVHEGTTREAEAFIIIDDERDMGPLNHRLINTAGHIGLTMKDALKAIELLRPEAPRTEP